MAVVIFEYFIELHENLNCTQHGRTFKLIYRFGMGKEQLDILFNWIMKINRLNSLGMISRPTSLVFCRFVNALFM